jgi:hypothetical protein
MNRCLTDQALLQCYTAEGAADDLAHLKTCLACAGRYKQLDSDMGMITQALDAAPPRRARHAAGVFARWRVPVMSAAVVAAFMVGWSLRGVSVRRLTGQPAQVALHEPVRSSAPIQLSALEPGAIKAGGAAPAMYAAYVQGAFGEEPCSESNDPLEPGCP